MCGAPTCGGWLGKGGGVVGVWAPTEYGHTTMATSARSATRPARIDVLRTIAMSVLDNVIGPHVEQRWKFLVIGEKP